MKKFNLILILFVSVLAIQFCFVPNTFAATEENTNPNTSQIPVSSVRIAIYDEPDISYPSYTSVGFLTNNHTLINSIFNSAGYDVSYLSTADIYNHKLMTASYDVFVLNDNVPRDNITDYVTEFWLGGGSLLTFDSAVSYLCYFGILPPESAGDDGYGVYWSYDWSENESIFTRHPVSKAYEVSDTFNVDYYDWASFDWTALLGTSIASQLTRIATVDGDTNSVTVLGFVPEDQGGKVLHILSSQGLTADQLLIDAIEWLCPRPKGRILFDLSHEPYYGIDPWDLLSHFPDRYTTWRDELVSRTYMIDKLYPSSTGNLTATNLAPYDVLIIVTPQLNFSSSEVNAVSTWITKGGSLLILGDNIAVSLEDMNINHLLSPYDLQMNLTDNGANLIDYQEIHPTTEGCTQLSFVNAGLVEYSGTAYPIWGNDDQHITVAGQEFGKGRIILTADINFLADSDIATDDNLQYGINLINWLTADDAKVLIFVHNPTNPDPNDNIYRGPVATALNELGRSFYMTFTKEYLNLSLSTGSYKLVVIDNSEFPIMDTVGTPLLNFLKAGGYMIISTYEYRQTSYNYLWDYIGFTYAGNYFSTPQSINIWNPTHSIFTSPVPYSATTLETSLNFVNTDYTNLTLHSNATGIAGLTPTSQVNGSAIIIGANKHVITNAMHLTEYFEDTDDDTYPDALQLWANEIAYMLTQIYPPTTTTGIPGYDIFTVSLSIFFSISILSLVYIKKRKIHTN